MLTLSLEQCIKATKNGAFSFRDLQLTNPISKEDLVLLCEYLRVTPLTSLDISMEINIDNSKGLKQLGQIIALNDQLVKLKFEVESVELDHLMNPDPGPDLLDFIDRRRLNKVNVRINDAITEMVYNKPNLEKLFIDLSLVKNPLDKSQAYQFSRSIRESPLKSLNLNLGVEDGAKLPILFTNQPNTTLTHLTLIGLTFGRDILRYLQQTNNLKSLVIYDMQLEADDTNTLGDILISNHSLSIVTLSQTNLGQLEAKPFFEALKHCAHLAFLELAKDDLSKLNIEEFCDYLKSASTKLIELDLTKNTYMDSDAKAIAESLVSCTQLEKLTVDGNFIENEGIQAIIKLLETNASINSISMSNTCRYHPSDETIEKLCAFISSPNCQLLDLNFDLKTNITQLKMLCDAILANSTLVSANLDHKNNSILAKMYKLYIQDHLDGLGPLMENTLTQFNAEQQVYKNSTQTSDKISMNAGGIFFSAQQDPDVLIQTKTTESPASSIQLV